MIKTIKVKLSPNKEQNLKMFQSANIARFSYNWALSKQINNEKYINCGDLRKEFTKLRNDNDYFWLKEVSSEIPQQAIKDLDDAFKKFFNKQTKCPKFKKKSKTQLSFFHLGNKIKVIDNKIYLEKIGWMKMKDDYRLPRGDYKKDKIKVYNPRIKFNGKYWILTIGLDFPDRIIPLNDNTIGIDLGLKDLAIVSNIDKPFKNINKSKNVKKLNKKLKRNQRKISKKYINNKQDNKYVKTKNILKLERKQKLIYKKISDIRLNHIYQTINCIVKTKPCRIIVEDLNVRGMMKNKYLAKSIAEQSFNMFITILEHKCKEYNIEFIKANRFYPSSKLCSKCGEIKKDLKLSDRIYMCECGLIIDRDKNASINLANYKLV